MRGEVFEIARVYAQLVEQLWHAALAFSMSSRSLTNRTYLGKPCIDDAQMFIMILCPTFELSHLSLKGLLFLLHLLVRSQNGVFLKLLFVMGS